MKYYHIAGYWCQLKAKTLIQYLFLRPYFYVFWEEDPSGLHSQVEHGNKKDINVVGKEALIRKLKAVIAGRQNN
ncbi:hypothetical protein [Nostoc sp. TCL240-02]|uniref:hypothetical protein n=1 Tax=Nostoc sp. TCL240-02 TaxID=2572090 RepID=UPI00157F88DE|nr:hypothetical protein [Nostoc sp. TCL240-02]QKQ74740.1 hypothetical protein FBB35_16650 [Nostoc sp. TCL240-02]